jgi:hypothetical protein
MDTRNGTDVLEQFRGNVIGAMTVGMSMQAQYGDQPLQDLVDAGVTGSDFWDFFKEVADRNIDLIAQLSREGELKSTAEAWKAKQH